ncbi:hypothetical protein [Octadecabacter temperatus]|nr:hypothetical protein [Octadecabacter temperatus]
MVWHGTAYGASAFATTWVGERRQPISVPSDALRDKAAVHNVV